MVGGVKVGVSDFVRRREPQRALRLSSPERETVGWGNVVATRLASEVKFRKFFKITRKTKVLVIFIMRIFYSSVTEKGRKKKKCKRKYI